MKMAIVFLWLMGILFPHWAWAHAPTGIDIKADFKTEQLHVKIRHPVSNPRNYYIKKVEIFVDEKAPIVRHFFFQKGAYQAFTINIPGLAKVKKIKIKAYPIRGRFLEKEFDIQK
jgi:hypothetical protein